MDARVISHAAKASRRFNLGAVLPPPQANSISKTKVLSFIEYMIHPIDRSRLGCQIKNIGIHLQRKGASYQYDRTGKENRGWGGAGHQRKTKEELRAVVADEEEPLKATADQTGELIEAARGKAERIRPGFITGSSLIGLCLTARSACPSH
jgi:hypothetical protein